MIINKICSKMNLCILYIIGLYLLDKNPDRQVALFRSIFLSLLGIYLYTILFTNELFHFEVTPWKKTCLQSHPNRCPGCCLPGFNGKPINFEYTGDEERMNAICPSRKPDIVNNPHSYVSLENIYSVKDNIKESYRQREVAGVEEYCGPCNQVIE